MYSPAARPSRQRAAPAKKRRLSAITGISSFFAASIGLPAFRASVRASSSPCSSIVAASASSASARTAGVVRGHPRAVELLGCGLRRPRQLLAGGGVEHGFGLALRGDPLAVDEVAEDLCCARHLALPSSGCHRNCGLGLTM